MMIVLGNICSPLLAVSSVDMYCTQRANATEIITRQKLRIIINASD